MRCTVLWTLLLLGLGLPVEAAIYTIGPDGAFATIGAAIADADANPDNHEFRLQAGTHVGGVVFAVNGEKVWRISGGWNASFTDHPVAPSQTTWQAGGLGGTVLTFNLTSTAQLHVENVTIFGGLGVGAPGGVYGGLGNGSQFSLSDCRVSGHQSTAGFAGLRLEAAQTSRITVNRCEVITNTVVGSGQKVGVGGSFRASNSATITVSHSYFGFNSDTVMSTGTFGAGLYVEGFGDAQITLTDNVIADNLVQASASSGAGMALSVFDNAMLTVDAVQIERNDAPNQTAGNRVQAYVGAFGTSGFGIANCLVANSALGGIYATHAGTGNGQITQCTVANNLGPGIGYGASAGSHRVANSIVHGNQGTTFGFILDPIVLRNNNVGDDVSGNLLNPQFVNATNDFHLLAGSPAIDSGSNTFNTSSTDLDFNPRVVNGVVDLGAYEFQAPTSDPMFASSFE